MHIYIFHLLYEMINLLTLKRKVDGQNKAYFPEKSIVICTVDLRRMRKMVMVK